MDSERDIDAWTAEDVKVCLTAAANAKSDGKVIWDLTPALPQVLAANIHGSLLQHVDKDFFAELGITAWSQRAPFQDFFSALCKQPSRTLARIKAGTVQEDNPPTTALVQASETAPIASHNQNIGVKRKRAVLKTVNVPDNTNSARTASLGSVQQSQSCWPPESLHIAQPHHKKAFMPIKRLDLDELFYGSTKVGSQVSLPMLPTEEQFGFMVSDSALQPFTKSHEYVISAPPAATTRFLNARMKYFFSEGSEMDDASTPGRRIVKMPYNWKMKAFPSVSVYDNIGGHCKITRGQLFPKADGAAVVMEEIVKDEFTSLTEKYPDKPDDEDLVDLDNVTEDAESSTAHLDSDDMAEESDEETSLVSAEKDIAIQEAIDCYTQDWHSKLEQLEARKARTVWRLMKNSKSIRDALIVAAQQSIAKRQKRLDFLRNEFMALNFTDLEELKRNCEAMRPTVEEIETQRWHIEVWRRRSAPDGPHSARSHIHSNSISQHPNNVSSTQFLLTSLGPGDRLSPTTPKQIPELEAQEVPAPSAEPIFTHFDSDAVMADSFIVDEEQQDQDSSQLRGHSEDIPHRLAEPPLARAARHDKLPETPIRSTALRTQVPNSTSVVTISSSDSPRPSLTPRTPKRSATKRRGLFGRVRQPASIVSSDEEDDFPRKRIKTEVPSPLDRDQAKRRHIEAARKELESMTGSDIHDLDAAELMLERDYTKLLLKLLHLEGQHFFTQLKTICEKHASRQVSLFAAALRQLIGQASDLADLLQNEDVAIMLRAARILSVWYARKDDSDFEDVPELLDDEDQIQQFCHHLARVFKLDVNALFAMKTANASQPILLDISADETDDSSSSTLDRPPSKHKDKKKKKRRIVASQAAKRTRMTAHDRQARFERIQSSQSELTKMIDPQDGKELIINLVREEDTPPIFVNRQLAQHLKSHQIEGVQFIWRELTALEDGVCGCLLAHTMGLGKTLQAITTMLTIVETARSSITSIRDQLPKALRPTAVVRGQRQLRILVLLPPALITNWTNEILNWTKKAQNDLGDIFSFTNETADQRLSDIQLWADDGGVLLFGYQMFRDTVHGRGKLKPEDQLSRGAQILIEQAELVIADEAHAFKDPKSKTSKAVAMLHAQHRLALTGTPLSNDIDEVYALVSWASPGYLGDQAWFNEEFGKPIKEGLFRDSSSAEIRRSKKRLEVLRAQTEPKVLRRDVTVLKSELPPKIEYILTVAPTQVQRKACCNFIQALHASQQITQATSQVQLFSWLNAMVLLFNHPSTFRRKLLEKPKPKPKKRSARTDREDVDTGSDVADAPADKEQDESIIDLSEDNLLVHGLTEAVRQSILEQSNVTDSIDMSLSAKTELFMAILKRSLAVGDKTLVFTGTLMTLDYLSDLLDQHTVQFGRIEGKTPAKEREMLMKHLKDNRLRVLLISTKAGALGYNMQGANRVVIFDSGFNPTHEEQAIARAYRLGQKKPVFVYRFITGGTFEVNMENKQLFKTSLAQRVVDKKDPLRNATRAVKEWLHEPEPVDEADISSWLGKDEGVLDEIIAAQLLHSSSANKIYSIRTMETLQADAKDADLDAVERAEVAQEIQEHRSRRLMTRQQMREQQQQQSATRLMLPSSGTKSGDRVM